MKRIFGGFFVMQRAIYQKPFKTVAEQIALLEGRGLSVDIGASDFAAFLRSVNYYRFSGYALPFRDAMSGNYTDDLKFSDVVALYRFDCRLRELVGDALGAVEVTLRTILAEGPLYATAMRRLTPRAASGDATLRVR